MCITTLKFQYCTVELQECFLMTLVSMIQLLSGSSVNSAGGSVGSAGSSVNSAGGSAGSSVGSSAGVRPIQQKIRQVIVYNASVHLYYVTCMHCLPYFLMICSATSFCPIFKSALVNCSKVGLGEIFSHILNISIAHLIMLPR